MYEASDQYSAEHIGHAACRATGTALDSSCHLPHINPANASAASCTIRLAQTREVPANDSLRLIIYTEEEEE